MGYRRDADPYSVIVQNSVDPNLMCRHRSQHLLLAFFKVQMGLMNIAAAFK